MNPVQGPVAITGASGFIASHLVQQLLGKGYEIRGSVRKEKADYHFLTSLKGASSLLTLHKAQLLKEGSYDDMVRGCEVVHHTASPYSLTVNDPQKDLVDPAVKGTLNVLKACAKSKTVKRVVLTSSMAAMTDEPQEGYVYTEKDWNEKSNLERNPYYYSKVLAEKAAWKFVEDEKPGFDLVTINPFLVIGPAKTQTLNTSNAVIANALNGTYPGIVKLAWGFVDARDVAAAHILAMETKDAKGRYLCANKTLTLDELVKIIKEAGFSDYKLPKLRMDGGFGNTLLKISSYFQPKGVRTYLQTHIGKIPSFDNTKIVSELKMEFRPIEETIKETVEDLIFWGHLPDRR